MSECPISVRTFLGSVREAKLEMRRCEWRLEQLRSQCESVTSQLRDTPAGGAGDKHKDDLMIALADFGANLADRHDNYARVIDNVENFLYSLDKPEHRVILRLRYVDLLRWGDVLNTMHEYGIYYSERGMFKLHKAAMNEAREKWEVYRENSDSKKEDQ